MKHKHDGKFSIDDEGVCIMCYNEGFDDAKKAVIENVEAMR